MRFSPLYGAALALAFVAPAAAQDMLGPWTGFYAGVNAGAGFGKSNAATTGQAAINNSTVADGARPPFTKLDTEGFLAGGQVGYNWQMGSWVYGLEADLQDADVRDTRNNVTTGSAFPGTRNNVFRQELEYLGTLRGRLGYAWGDTLLYGTGGLAYGNVNNSANFSGPLPAATPQFAGGINNTKYGYAAGGGIEQAFGDNWSVKTEYLYYDLGSNVVPVGAIPGSGGAGVGYDVRFANRGHIARVGLNYRF
jgi:outer membrane immunogenic protein